VTDSQDTDSQDNEAPCYGIDDVDIIATSELYQGFFKMQEFRLKHRLMKGGWSQTLSRECLMRPPAVGVLLYDPYQDAVVLLEQFRIGALDYEAGPWLLELVAGLAQKI